MFYPLSEQTPTPSPTSSNSSLTTSDDALQKLPTTPPHGNLYCDVLAMHPPLISPTLAKGCVLVPSMYFCSGQEMLAHDSKVTASPAQLKDAP